MRAGADLFDAPDDGFDLRLGGARLHHDHHLLVLLGLCTLYERLASSGARPEGPDVVAVREHRPSA
jgi:hypothetical protein